MFLSLLVLGDKALSIHLSVTYIQAHESIHMHTYIRTDQFPKSNFLVLGVLQTYKSDVNSTSKILAETILLLHNGRLVIEVKIKLI